MKGKSDSFVITGDDTRLAYLHAWKPKTVMGGDAKYSAVIIIPKTNTEMIERLNRAVECAYTEGRERLKDEEGNVPELSEIDTPIRDGDAEAYGSMRFEGCVFFRASTTIAPGIVDRNFNPITDHSLVYSGILARVSLSFYAFNKGKRGIAVSLHNIMKVGDGEPMWHNRTPESDFKED